MSRILVIAFAIFTCILPVSAELPMSFHNVLMPGTGTAYCMEKDEKGLLWIGTGDGLYCYPMDIDVIIEKVTYL